MSVVAARLAWLGSAAQAAAGVAGWAEASPLPPPQAAINKGMASAAGTTWRRSRDGRAAVEAGGRAREAWAKGMVYVS
ncbi:hypothetical protein GmRootA79_01200 [Acidovorax sp. A79]